MRDEMIQFLNTYTDYSYEILVTFSDDILRRLCKLYGSEFRFNDEMYFANPLGYEALCEVENV